jgi:hypothetical protein
MNTTRRDLLKSGAAVAAVAASGAIAAADLSLRGPVPAALRFHKVAYDGRFGEATLFAARARALGADVHDIDGDITDLWYEHLYPQWKRAPIPVAGITRFNSLLALQLMAGIGGLRVIYRASHARDRARTSHELYGPRAALAMIPPLAGAPERWAPAAAGIVMRWRADWTAIDRGHSTILDADARGLPADALISWILAPVRQRAA